MKAFKYLWALVVGAMAFASCDTDIENTVIEKPYTYSDLYYQNLRDYKNTDHSIAFGWFAQYGSGNSLAVRFMGLPDSLDICSLWGGIPAKGTDTETEMRFVQKVKGTKMLVVSICRIDAETNDHDYKQAYDAARASGDADELNRALEMYAEYFIDLIFENDLDGFDADYEPEGDFLSGSYFLYFMNHIAKYMGPNPNITKAERLALIRERYGDEVASQEGICDKLLCVDAPSDPSQELTPICNYYFKQAYSGGTSTSWTIDKVVFCCNMGDNWQGTMSDMYAQARYQPTKGRKGGFGAFFIHRDYNVHDNNPSPYYRFRECIQIQNPAVR